MLWRFSWSCLVGVGVVGIGACSDATGRADDDPVGNHPPVLVKQQATTAEDTPVDVRVLDGARDGDGDELRVTEAAAVGHTVEVVDAAIVRVVPARDFQGQIDVTYKVSDGTAFATGHAIVTVSAINDAPVALGGILNIHRSAMVALDAHDVDNDALTYEIVTPPAHGTLTGQAPKLEYTAVTGYLGDDAFTYRALDGSVASAPATIELHVVPGSAPTAIPGVASGNEDASFNVVLHGSDPDNDPLTYAVVTSPVHGTLTGSPPNLVYRGALDYNGGDSLTFTVDDGYGTSSTATVTITVTAINDAPVATSKDVAVDEDAATAITLEGSDVDSAALTFQALTLPLHGTLSGSGANRTYTPVANYHGPDSFTFTAFDGVLATSGTVAISVASVEDVPVAQAVSKVLSEDNPASVTLVGSDGDGDALSFAVVTAPAHGTVTGTGTARTYTPVANYNGADSFTYSVSDGDDTVEATVTLQVTAVNDDPVVTGSSVTTAEDTAVAIRLQATDVDSPTLTYTFLALPTDGSLSGTAPDLTYTPALNVSGSRSFRFRAHDGAGGFNDATVTIAITPVNDPPTTVDDFAFTEPGAPVTFAVVDNDTDLESNAVLLDSVAAPAHGGVEIVDGKLVYTPDAGFTGEDLIAYTAVDSLGDAATGHAHVGVGTFPEGAPTEAIATVGGSISAGNIFLAPAISEDGRFMALVSALPLVADDTNGLSDIFVFDRGTHTIARVSVATGGAQSNGSSFRPHISADGRYVVFDASAGNLVGGDTNAAFDVFRHDRVTGETIRISVATGGGQANGNSQDAEISDDGNLVVFTSNAFDLVASDANGVQDVFVHNVAAGTTTRVSITASGGEADLASTEPTISGNGRYVAFTSTSTNLVAGDVNNVSDVFVRDLVASATTRVSVSSTGGEANNACSRASLSRDGRFIAFRSTASNLVGGTPPPAQVFQLYVRDTLQQITTLPLVLATSIAWGRLSADGRYATASTSSGIFIRDRFAGTSSALAGSSSWVWPMLSGNGRYVVALDALGGGRALVIPNPL